jgi:hypothetical protein
VIRALLRGSGPLLAALLVLAAFLGWRAVRLPADFSVGRLYGTASEEFAAFDRFRSEFGSDDTLLYVAFETPDAFAPETLRLLQDLGKRLGGVPGVGRTWGLPDALALYPFPFDARREVESSPLFRGTLFAEDRRAACLWVTLDPRGDRRAALGGIRAVLASAAGREFHVSGAPVVEHEYEVLTKRDLRTFMPLAAGIFLVLLAVYFRNLAGTLLPLLTVGIAIAATLGTMELLGLPMGLLSSLVPSLILVLGIADTIHLLAHHREEVAAGGAPREALERGLRMMLPACLLTSFTTAVGFASLVTTPVPAIREFGLVAAGGILIAYAVTAVLLPAALLRLPPFRAHAWSALGGRLLEAVGRVNERRALAVGAAAAVAVAAAGFGIARIRRESSWLHDLGRGHPVRRAHEFFEERLSGVFSVDLRIDGPLRGLGALRRVAALEEEIARWRLSPEIAVRHVAGFPDLVRELRPGRPRALPATQEEYDAVLRRIEALARAPGPALRLVDPEFRSCRLSVRMRGMTSRGLDALGRDLEARSGGIGEGLRVSVTGKTWVAKRAMDRTISSMLSSLGLATAVIFGSMAILFRSPAVGLLAIVPNVLPMVFTAGLMGWAGIDLNFSTVTVFSISLGIAVDTTIHYLARLRVELGRDGDPAAAMRRAVRGAGGPMIFGTLLLVVGFGSILTSNFLFTFHFGLLGGFTLLTALLCDLFVTPTLFRVLGTRLWKKRLDAG